MRFEILFVTVALALADLRMGSQPRNGYKLRQYGRRNNQRFVQEATTNGKVLYMEPATFGYKGLERQKARNYDNFLRSNIDNEQDNRNFVNEDGKDHLPFRTEMEVEGVPIKYTERGQNVDLPITVYPGQSKLIPLRWNNPHASELEVNIWLIGYDVVVPIKRPTCSGEGHQNNVVEFTVPDDFRGQWTTSVSNSSKTFKGCNEPGDCVIQFYAHSVESRTYSTAVPIIIPDPAEAGVTIEPRETPDNIEEPTDPEIEFFKPVSSSKVDIIAASTRQGREGNKVILKDGTTDIKFDTIFFFTTVDVSLQLVDKVVFSIDNLKRKVEYNAPFEMTTIGFSRTEIGNGEHEISAEITFNDGTTQKIVRKFNIGNRRRRLQVAEVDEDPWLDLNKLKRDTCLPANDPYADIRTSKPKKANLVSDVYNHAYQNSNFSPYQGQQHAEISRNMQAAAVIHMISGNRGELGKNNLPNSLKQIQKRLNKQVNQKYKAYERVANKIIDRVMANNAKNTGTVAQQPLANCFRCVEKGATSSKRLRTTTYVPSFKIEDPTLLEQAKGYLGNYQNLISENNVVQIYVATMMDMMPYFNDAAKVGLTYQPAAKKDSILTKNDTTAFKKRNEDGKRDGGQYAATQAKYSQIEGCPQDCFQCDNDKNALTHPLIRGSAGTCVEFCQSGNCSKTANTGVDCTSCKQYFTNEVIKPEIVAENIILQADPEYDQAMDDFETLQAVAEDAGRSVEEDLSGQCMTESQYNATTNEEIVGMAIPGKCEDNPCDNDDYESLCKCQSLDFVDEIFTCMSARVTAGISALFLVFSLLL